MGEGSVRRSDRVSWRRLGDETVVLDLRRRRVFGLNAAGSDVWHALHGNADPETLRELAGGERETLEAFLAELAENGLVTGNAPDPSSRPRPHPGPAPRICWQEPLREFAQLSTCNSYPGNSADCNSNQFNPP